MIKKIIFVLGALVVVAQFFRPEKNLGAAAGPNDISASHEVPAEVKSLLQRACYDCHSNRTHYPWYAEIQPLGWWLASHVKDGKQHLNFSEFGTYSVKRAVSKLEEISDTVSQEAMPLPSYTWGHPEARLTAVEIALLVGWADDLRDEIAPE